MVKVVVAAVAGLCHVSLCNFYGYCLIVMIIKIGIVMSPTIVVPAAIALKLNEEVQQQAAAAMSA